VKRVEPPSGRPPPTTIRLSDDTVVELQPIAAEICARYASEFPDEQERYGAAGQAWCLHDNLYLLAWAIADAHLGAVRLEEQVRWLADVLAARDFPLDRLERDLTIAAATVSAHDARLAPAALRLGQAAGMVRETYLEPPGASAR
jgi:hypothetical protein